MAKKSSDRIKKEKLVHSKRIWFWIISGLIMVLAGLVILVLGLLFLKVGWIVGGVMMFIVGICVLFLLREMFRPHPKEIEEFSKKIPTLHKKDLKK